jgi:hypothetical protein
VFCGYSEDIETAAGGVVISDQTKIEKNA